MSADWTEAKQRFPLPLDMRAVPPWECKRQTGLFGWMFSKQEYYLASPFRYLSRDGRIHDVEAGFRIDGATVPLELPRRILDDDSPDILYPSVIHDKLCKQAAEIGGEEGRKLRAYADNLLVEMMEVVRANRVRRAIAFRGVRIGAVFLVMLALFFCSGCSAVQSYEKTVSYRQVSVSAAGSGKDYKGSVSYMVKYR